MKFPQKQTRLPKEPAAETVGYTADPRKDTLEKDSVQPLPSDETRPCQSFFQMATAVQVWF